MIQQTMKQYIYFVRNLLKNIIIVKKDEEKSDWQWLLLRG